MTDKKLVESDISVCSFGLSTEKPEKKKSFCGEAERLFVILVEHRGLEPLTPTLPV